VVLAEAVGSCTDLQSTVVRPLRHFYGEQLRVAPLTVLVDPVRYAGIAATWADPASEPDLSYLYRHQLDEADIIAVNKADLLGAGEAETVKAAIQERFAHARIVLYSAVTGQGLDELVALWTGDSQLAEHTAFAVDYDRYGAAEAELAWTNQTLTVTAVDPAGFAPAKWVEQFLTAFSGAAGTLGTTVGHVKLRATSPDGTTKASLTGAGAAPSFDEQHWIPAQRAEIVLNARVQVSPEDLDTLIADAAEVADTGVGARSEGRAGDIFRPGFPVPVHRM
jgi:G3E family GTPase